MPYYPPPSAGGGTQSPVLGANPYLLHPNSPSIYDDEFEGGSADLEARGWKFRDTVAPTVAMIRDGDIQPFYAFAATQTNPIPAGHYRSTIYGSVLFLQTSVALNKQYILYKTVPAISSTWPAGMVSWLRAARYGHSNALAVSGTVSSEIAYTTTGGTVWDDNNRVYAQTYNTGASQNTTNAAGRVIAGTDTTAGTYAETGSTGHKYDIVGSYIFANASGVVTNTRHNPFFIDSQPLSGVLSDSTKMLNHALNPTLFTAFGLRLESGNSIGTIQTGPSVPYAYAIDFVRFFAGDITNKWIAG